MGCKGSKPVEGADGHAGKQLKRTKSITVDAKRMRKTKSSVYDVPDKGGDPNASALTRRTSVLAQSGNRSMALPAPGEASSPGSSSHPEITVGVDTHVGDPMTHANEDRATAILDLLGKFPPAGKEYSGDDNRMVSFFGVYDGHGGDTCSEWLRNHLHEEVAKDLYVNNTHEKLPASVTKTFEEVEEGPCSRFAPGSCCCTVMIKDRKIYCADAGDSMAVIVGPDKSIASMVKLNDRHGVEFSKQEIERLRACEAEVATDYEMEGAVIGRDSRGRFIKALYPTRGFGDADFKAMVAPKPVVVSTPTGRGMNAYEGPAYECKGSGPYWLLIGCDGLWDFMTEAQIHKTWFQKDTPQEMAEHLVKVAQAAPYSSYDDVTCIVCKLEFQ